MHDCLELESRPCSAETEGTAVDTPTSSQYGSAYVHGLKAGTSTKELFRNVEAEQEAAGSSLTPSPAARPSAAGSTTPPVATLTVVEGTGDPAKAERSQSTASAPGSDGPGGGNHDDPQRRARETMLSGLTHLMGHPEWAAGRGPAADGDVPSIDESTVASDIKESLAQLGMADLSTENGGLQEQMIRLGMALLVARKTDAAAANMVARKDRPSPQRPVGSGSTRLSLNVRSEQGPTQGIAGANDSAANEGLRGRPAPQPLIIEEQDSFGTFASRSRTVSFDARALREGQGNGSSSTRNGSGAGKGTGNDAPEMSNSALRMRKSSVTFSHLREQGEDPTSGGYKHWLGLQKKYAPNASKDKASPDGKPRQRRPGSILRAAASEAMDRAKVAEDERDAAHVQREANQNAAIRVIAQRNQERRKKEDKLSKTEFDLEEAYMTRLTMEAQHEQEVSDLREHNMMLERKLAHYQGEADMADAAAGGGSSHKDALITSLKKRLQMMTEKHDELKKEMKGAGLTPGSTKKAEPEPVKEKRSPRRKKEESAPPGEMLKLREQITDLGDQLEAAQREIEDLKDENLELREATQRAKNNALTQIASFEKDMQQIEERNQFMQTMVDDFKQKLRQSNFEIEKRDDSIRKLEAEVAAQKARADKLSDEQSSLQADMERQKSDVAAAKKKKEDADAAKQKGMAADLAAANEERNALREKLADAEKQVEELKDDVSLLKKRLEMQASSASASQEDLQKQLTAEFEKNTQDAIANMQAEIERQYEEKLRAADAEAKAAAERAAEAARRAAMTVSPPPGSPKDDPEKLAREQVAAEREKHLAELKELEGRSKAFAKHVIKWVMDTSKTLNPHVDAELASTKVKKEDDVLTQLPLILTAVTSVCDALKQASLNLAQARREAVGAQKNQETKAAWEEKFGSIMSKAKAQPMPVQCEAIARMLKWQHAMKTMWQDRKQRLKGDLQSKLERVLAAPHEDGGYSLFDPLSPLSALPTAPSFTSKTLSAPSGSGPSSPITQHMATPGFSDHFIKLPDRAPQRASPRQPERVQQQLQTHPSPLSEALAILSPSPAASPLGSPSCAALPGVAVGFVDPRRGPAAGGSGSGQRRMSKPSKQCPLCNARIDAMQVARDMRTPSLTIARVRTPHGGEGGRAAASRQAQRGVVGSGDAAAEELAPLQGADGYALHGASLDPSLRGGRERAGAGGGAEGDVSSPRSGRSRSTPEGESWMFSSNTKRVLTPATERVTDHVRRHLNHVSPLPSAREAGVVAVAPISVSAYGGPVPPPPAGLAAAVPVEAEQGRNLAIAAENRTGHTPKDREREAVQRRKTRRLQAEQLKMLKSLQEQELFRTVVMEERRRRQMETHSCGPGRTKKAPGAAAQRAAAANLVDNIVAVHDPAAVLPPLTRTTSAPLHDGQQEMQMLPPDDTDAADAISIDEVNDLLRTIQSAGSGGGGGGVASKARGRQAMKPARKAVATI